MGLRLRFGRSAMVLEKLPAQPGVANPLSPWRVFELLPASVALRRRGRRFALSAVRRGHSTLSDYCDFA
jgi:hypothetical protein